MALIQTIGRSIAAQRGQLLCWAPACLALGIGIYFRLDHEPGPMLWAFAVAASAGMMLLARISAENWRPVLHGMLLVVVGSLLAGIRAQMVSEPVLEYRYYGPVQGRIVQIDRSASDAVRLTLDRVVLKRTDPGRTPERVRVSLHGPQGFAELRPGLTVILTAHLAPPSGPIEPGGFDFRRQAWFDRLGAVGYTRTPVLELGFSGPGRFEMQIYRLRMAISQWARTRMPGEAGAFAAAVMTGDRSALGRVTLENLRASNLAHLLAISGLHMGLLTGLVFGVVRGALALVPPLALRWPIKKIAALLALLAGAGYLALSGGNVATERAYIMVSVMFMAVLLDRRAITLRAVAVAAIIVLVLRPEVLAEPGFQMSFAATVALVAVFGAMRGRTPARLPRWLRPVLAVAISSAVAGAATAPVAAAHFNRIADFGLLANLLSVPLMGLVVVPGGVLAAILAPLGLGAIGLSVMRPAIEWILGVAAWVAGLEGALTHVKAPSGAVVPLIALGALWIILWRGPFTVRAAGCLPVMAGFALWAMTDRPAALIADTGGLVGVLGAEGRALSKAKGGGFAARGWLENDGDGASQKEAFERPGLRGTKGMHEFQVGTARFLLLTGRGADMRAQAHCPDMDFIVVPVDVSAVNGKCTVLDARRLRETGAIAVYPDGEGVRLVAAKAVSGIRLWNSSEVRADWKQRLTVFLPARQRVRSVQ